MALLSPEEVSAVKSRLSGWSSKPPGRGGKTETHAAKLKEQGNQHFKRKKNLQALQCYSEVVYQLLLSFLIDFSLFPSPGHNIVTLVSG